VSVLDNYKVGRDVTTPELLRTAYLWLCANLLSLELTLDCYETVWLALPEGRPHTCVHARCYCHY